MALGYKSPVLQAVANPATMLLIPFEMAIMNVVASIVIALLLFMLFGFPMFFGVLIAILNHIWLIYVAQRDQHIVTVLRAMGRYKRHTANLIPTKRGAKYVP